jgi:hypothetical protein
MGSGWNRGWVSDCFGEETLSQISNRIIACSGVSIGTRDSVLAYLQQMSSTLEQRRTCICHFFLC